MNFFSDLINTILHLHPIHAMVVHFPIALSGAGFLFILIAWWKKNPAFEKAAYFNQFLTAISVIAASATGIIDNETRWADAAPNHGWKIALGMLMFILSAGIVYLRWRKPDLFDRKNVKGWYITVYGVIFAIALVLGFLGGVIVYGFSGSNLTSVTPNATDVAAAATPLPNTSGATIATVSFSGDVLPIFTSNCTGCHSSANATNGIALDTYANVTAGRAIVAGNADRSRVVREIQSGRMPPGGKLSSADIQKIVDWINQGALDN